MNALIFAGQGSQYVGMMKDLAEEFPQAKSLIQNADEILGCELSKICFDGPTDVLKETRYTQPALFVHEAVLVSLLSDKISFDAVAGHSLGEYSALFSAGVLDFESALNLVKLRGELMFRAGEKVPGTMFAVIGLADEKVSEICEKLTNGENIVVPANYNSPGQIVVSGSATYLRENSPKFKEAGARMVMELPVSGAFHSPLMQAAKETLASAIHSAKFNDAKVDVFCNVSAKPVRKADDLRTALIEQLVSPVLWSQTMENMQKVGITKFFEVGPGNVLQGLLKRTLQNVTFSGFDKADSIRKWLEA